MNTLISCEMCLPFFCTFLLRFVLTCFLKDLVTDCLISCVKSIFWQFFGHCFQDSLSHIVWHSCDILCEIAFLYCSCNGLRNSVSHSFYFVFCISCGIYWRSFLSFFDFFWHTCRQSIQQIFWHSSWRKSECMVACGVCVDPTDHAGHGYVLQKNLESIWFKHEGLLVFDWGWCAIAWGKNRVFSHRSSWPFSKKHLQLQAVVDQFVERLMSRPFGGIHPKGDWIGNHLKENATCQQLNILEMSQNFGRIFLKNKSSLV